MTIPVVASALQKQPRKVEYLRDAGMEIAGHGDVHVPFVGPVDSQVRRPSEMNRIFKETLGESPAGFRAPFLAHDSNLYPALAKAGLRYDSSRIARDILLRIRNLLSKRPLAYRDPARRLPSLLTAHVLGKTASRPYEVAPGVIELPVFELDDWYFIESDRGPRLRPEEGALLAQTWLSAVRHFSRPGNLLVLQAHPGRISPGYLKALESFLEESQRLGSEFLSLRELARRVSVSNRGRLQ